MKHPSLRDVLLYVSLFIGVQMKNSWSIAQHSTNMGRLRESLDLTKNTDQIIIRRTKKGWEAGFAKVQNIADARRTTYGYPIYSTHEIKEDTLKVFGTYEEAQEYVDSLGEQNQEPLKLRTSLL